MSDKADSVEEVGPEPEEMPLLLGLTHTLPWSSPDANPVADIRAWAAGESAKWGTAEPMKLQDLLDARDEIASRPWGR